MVITHTIVVDIHQTLTRIVTAILVIILKRLAEVIIELTGIKEAIEVAVNK